MGDDGDLGASTINVKKCRRWAPWLVLTVIREHPPSTLKDVDGGAPTGCCRRSGSAHHQRLETLMAAPKPA
jgi:hypothetical protein